MAHLHGAMRASSAVLAKAPLAPRGLLAATPRSAPQYPADPSWPAANQQLELALLAAVNAHRAGIGRRPLVLDATLVQIAEWKARQIAAYPEGFDHADHAPPVSRPFGDRFIDYGYGAYPGQYAIGENLAWAWPDVAGVMGAWLSDEGHKANIESDAWVACGMGVATANGMPFWSQDFGSRPVGAPPTITGVSPRTVAVGGSIQITGTNLATTRSVSFDPGPAGGKMPAAQFHIADAFTVQAIVPTAAASGQALVTTDGGQALTPGITIGSAPSPPPAPPPTAPTPPKAGERWRNDRTGAVVTIDPRTTATVVYPRNAKGRLLARRPVKAFLSTYTRIT